MVEEVVVVVVVVVMYNAVDIISAHFTCIKINLRGAAHKISVVYQLFL